MEIPRINFLKVLSLIGDLSAELNKITSDGKIEPVELLQLGAAICQDLAIPITYKGIPINPAVLIELIEEAFNMIKDGKIEVAEVLKFVEDVCNKFGIQLLK